MQPTFIVGTGRCGTTMLSNLINQHPDILSLSEFFVFVADIGGYFSEAFTSESLDGSEFWDLIAGIKPRMNTLLHNDIVIPEILYPLESTTAKFSAKTGVPPILQTTLPHLTEDHDQLFEELEPFIRKQPRATVRWHYDNLFTRLRERFEKKVWVERSGAGLFFTEDLLRLYPEARFVHMFRDGRNTALSMARHIGFRMGRVAGMLKEYLGVDPFRSDERSNLHQVPEELHCFLPENFDRVAFLNFQLPLEIVGERWSWFIKGGLKVLSTLPPERVLTLGYENFCETPVVHLKKLVDFIGLKSDPGWLAETVSLVKTSSSSWTNLPEEQKTALEESCRPGIELLEKLNF